MKMSDLRAKARSIFGPADAEPMPNQPNGAKALQQRANARPIPTYKVGGVVKKQDGGRMSGRNTPEADDVLITTRRGQRILDEQKKREAEMERKRREKQARADKLLGIPAQKDGGKAGCYKDGGKVQTSSDTARKLAGEMGGMKHGGKPKKDGLAVMIAIGEPKKPVKKAVGGAGKTRKGMVMPVKKAQGGAGKVRKGMMTPEGQITHAMNKLRGK